MPGIDQILQQRMAVGRQDPQALMNSYQQNQSLMDLLALQKLKSDKEAAQRELAMQAGQGQMPTVKDQREQEMLEMTKRELAQQVGGVGDQQMAQQQDAMQKLMSGIASQPAPNMMGMAQGGVVGYQTGGDVGGQLTEREMVQKLEQRGYPTHVAHAITANMIAESGLDPSINEVSPTVEGSRGGFGLLQWTGPRRVALEEAASQQGVDPSDVDFQLDYMDAELGGPERRASAALSRASDTAEATELFSNLYLRPGAPRMENRLNYARELDEQAAGPAPLRAGVPGLPGLPRVPNLLPSVPNLLPDPTAPARAAGRGIAGLYGSLPDQMGGARGEDFRPGISAVEGQGTVGDMTGAMRQAIPDDLLDRILGSDDRTNQGQILRDTARGAGNVAMDMFRGAGNVATDMIPSLPAGMSDEEIEQIIAGGTAVRDERGRLSAFPTLSGMAQGDPDITRMSDAQRIGAIIRDLTVGPVTAVGQLPRPTTNIKETAGDFISGLANSLLCTVT